MGTIRESTTIDNTVLDNYCHKSTNFIDGSRGTPFEINPPPHNGTHSFVFAYVSAECSPRPVCWDGIYDNKLLCALRRLPTK